MDTLQRQVRRARRRLAAERFLDVLGWCWFAALLAALVLIAADKFWPLGVEAWAWAAGALGLGLLAAVVWTLLVRGSLLEAAIEIDRRFALKERVSSALSADAGRSPDGGGRGAAGRRPAPGRADRRGRAVHRQAAAAVAVAPAAGHVGRARGAVGRPGGREAGPGQDRRSGRETADQEIDRRGPPPACRAPRASQEGGLARGRAAVQEAGAGDQGIERRADEGEGVGQAERPLAALGRPAAAAWRGGEGQAAVGAVEEGRPGSGGQVRPGHQPRRFPEGRRRTEETPGRVGQEQAGRQAEGRPGQATRPDEGQAQQAGRRPAGGRARPEAAGEPTPPGRPVGRGQQAGRATGQAPAAGPANGADEATRPAVRAMLEVPPPGEGGQRPASAWPRCRRRSRTSRSSWTKWGCSTTPCSSWPRRGSK